MLPLAWVKGSRKLFALSAWVISDQLRSTAQKHNSCCSWHLPHKLLHAPCIPPEHLEGCSISAGEIQVRNKDETPVAGSPKVTRSFSP